MWQWEEMVKGKDVEMGRDGQGEIYGNGKGWFGGKMRNWEGMAGGRIWKWEEMVKGKDEEMGRDDQGKDEEMEKDGLGER